MLFGRAGVRRRSAGLIVAFSDWRRGQARVARADDAAGAAIHRVLSATAISAYVAALMTTTVADVLVIYATLPFFAAGPGVRRHRRAAVAAHDVRRVRSR